MIGSLEIIIIQRKQPRPCLVRRLKGVGASSIRINEIPMLTCGKTCFVVSGAFISLGYASFSHGTDVRTSTIGDEITSRNQMGMKLLLKIKEVQLFFVHLMLVKLILVT